MKSTIKMTDKEKKLLLMLLALIILVASYQFGYAKFMDKADSLQAENVGLSNKLMELQQKQANKGKYETENKELQEKYNSLMVQFPGDLTEERNLMFVTELESYAGMKVNSVSFGENSAFFKENISGTTVPEAAAPAAEAGNITADTAAGTAADTTDKPAAEADTNQAENSVDIVSSGQITGLKTSILLTYQATYEGLKKAIEFINSYKEKRGITDLTASFDPTTGNLTGTMSIEIYGAEGTGNAYTAPDIRDINVGTGNMFGTFEVPVDKTK